MKERINKLGFIKVKKISVVEKSIKYNEETHLVHLPPQPRNQPHLLSSPCFVLTGNGILSGIRALGMPLAAADNWLQALSEDRPTFELKDEVPRSFC